MGVSSTNIYIRWYWSLPYHNDWLTKYTKYTTDSAGILESLLFTIYYNLLHVTEKLPYVP